MDHSIDCQLITIVIGDSYSNKLREELNRAKAIGDLVLWYQYSDPSSDI